MFIKNCHHLSINVNNIYNKKVYQLNIILEYITHTAADHEKER